MAKSLKRRIEKLEGSRNTHNDNKGCFEKFRKQGLRCLREVMEREGIKPIAKEDYTNNEEGAMDLNVLMKTIRRFEEDEKKKS
jgi:hypothetical protein